MDNQARIQELEEENARLKEELQATKEHLKKYTAPASRREYYENNKEKEKQRAKEYKEKTSLDVPYENSPKGPIVYLMISNVLLVLIHKCTIF